MNIIDSIQLSGVTYTLQGSGGGTVSSAITSGDTNAVAGGAVYDKFDEVEQVTARALNDLDEKINPTVELTQAEYDNLPSSAKTSNTFFVITDATPVDVSQYWTSAQTQSAITQAISGKVNTSSVVSSVTSASTDSEIPTAKAVWEAASGGGTTYTAGRGISIANDTISFSLPISADTENNILLDGENTVSKYGHRNFVGGYKNDIFYWGNVVNGNNNIVYGSYNKIFYDVTRAKYSNNAIFGSNNTLSGTSNVDVSDSVVGGAYNYAGRGYTSIFGAYNKATNVCEHASGQYNVSSKASDTFGDSGNTLFSVGNGTVDNARHNAFEIRQNGDIYLSSGGTDIKLQDYLGGTASSAITSGDTNAVAGGAVYAKLDEMEQVIARALNDLNARITAIENQLNSNNS